MVINRSVLFRIREKGGKTHHTGHCSPQDISAESNLQQSTRTNNPEKTTLRRGNSGRYSLALTLEVGGAGGIRTHVRTRKPIRFLHAYSGQCFRASARTGLPTDTLSPKISPAHWGLYRLFPIFLHRLTLRFGTTSLERCLVLSPGDGIKPVIYCTSIRQRERSCFRQLNFCPLRLWR